MGATRLHRSPLIEWGAAGRALPGEVVSGDLHLVQPFEHGALAAVVDGLGHGDEANAAAKPALSVLEAHAGESVITLMKLCHNALTHTRGAVMTLASFNELDSTVTCLSVGNVAGLLVRADARAIPQSDASVLRPGVVGFQLPALRASVFNVAAGDLFIFASDGIRGDFDQGIIPGDGAQRIADRIIKGYFKGTDDGLTLVVRYLGKPDEQ